MTTYFGETTPGGYSDHAPVCYWWRNKNKVFTCPGSGAQDLVELSAYVYRIALGTGHIRLAIYDTSNNLLYQGSAEVTVDNADPDWIGHTGITGQTLTGGTNYRIALTTDSSDVEVYYNLYSIGDFTSLPADYTGGWPNPLADQDDDDYAHNARAGVDPPIIVPGGGPVDDRRRFRFSRLEGYTSTRLRRHNAQWHPSTGILNPALDALEDSDSRMF